MTKKKIARKTGRTKPAPKPAETPRPEPTFTLASVAEAFGFAYGDHMTRPDPIYFAKNVINDAHRTLRLVEECLCDGVDAAVLQDVTANAAHRMAVAEDLLTPFMRLEEYQARREGGAS